MAISLKFSDSLSKPQFLSFMYVMFLNLPLLKHHVFIKVAVSQFYNSVNIIPYFFREYPDIF